MYMDRADTTKKVTPMDLNGFHLWRSIENVIILEESMRHNSDAQFGQCLKNVRRGMYMNEEVRMLNQRVMNVKVRDEYAKCREGLTPMVVGGNDLRMALNWKSVGKMRKELGLKRIVCAAEMVPSKTHYFSCHDMGILLQSPDNHTSNLPALLPLLPGMPVRITQNIAVEICIANGTEGTLLGVQFPVGTTFESAKCFGVDCMEHTI